MGQPAAKQGDQIVATDTHIVMIPSPGGPVPTPLPSPFTGMIDGALSGNVNIEGKPAAVQAPPPPISLRIFRRADPSRSRRRTRPPSNWAAPP